jgi:hypothetical protein
MKKRYLRFQAWSAPILQPNAQKIDCVIDITKIENMTRGSKQISICFNNDYFQNYYFNVEAQSKKVYDKIWEMLIQQEG